MSIGFGTYKLDSKTAYHMVRLALSKGYRTIDTATLYNNEEAVGKAVNLSGIERKEIFLITKVQKSDIMNNRIKQAVLASIQKLGKIDLVLLHVPTLNYIQAWRVLQEIKQWPCIGDVGVSNFDINMLQNLYPKPKYNQIEITPFYTRNVLVDYCKLHNITILAHTPLTKGIKLGHSVLHDIASKYDITPAQVMISWSVQQGFIPLVRTSNYDHLLENRETVKLDDEDISILNGLDEHFMTHKYNL